MNKIHNRKTLLIRWTGYLATLLGMAMFAYGARYLGNQSRQAAMAGLTLLFVGLAITGFGLFRSRNQDSTTTFMRVLFFCILTMKAPSLHAQTPSPPTAPLPALLSNTHSIFLGNAGDQENADCLRAYNDFYAGVDALHQFKLVDDPAQADLVVELHYEISLAGSKVSGDDSSRQFRAVLIDGKTHIVVWSLTEKSNYAVRQKNRDKNLDTVVEALVEDFASVVSSQPTPPSNKSKAHTR